MFITIVNSEIIDKISDAIKKLDQNISTLVQEVLKDEEIDPELNMAISRKLKKELENLKKKIEAAKNAIAGFAEVYKKYLQFGEDDRPTLQFFLS